MQTKRRNFFRRILQKKYIALASLIVVGVAIPFLFIEGSPSDTGRYVGNYVTGVLLFAITTMSLAFSTFADWLLRLSVSNEFMNIGYTTNPFVTHGWAVMRDFVNMFFIIVLIIIGLSTSLQIETYKWQKTLPRLVGVALLINFTPVILGIFIDASNIAMRYFTSMISQDSFFISQVRGLYSTIAMDLSRVMWMTFESQALHPTTKMVMFTLFNLFFGFVYFCYGILFTMRYVAIWLLVIISPLGFFCYILPATQPFFRRWWSWFIGWCLAGVAAAAFLYFGEIILQQIGRETIMPRLTEHQGVEVGAFVGIFPLMIPMFFSFFGLLVTFAISSAGAKAVVQGFQKTATTIKKPTINFSTSMKEKTADATGAVKNAFRAPVQPSSTPGAGGAPSSPTTTRRADSLHRRKATDSDLPGSQGFSQRPSSIEITTYASEGTKGAVEEIAGLFSEEGRTRQKGEVSQMGGARRSETTPKEGKEFDSSKFIGSDRSRDAMREKREAEQTTSGQKIETADVKIKEGLPEREGGGKQETVVKVKEGLPEREGGGRQEKTRVEGKGAETANIDMRSGQTGGGSQSTSKTESRRKIERVTNRDEGSQDNKRPKPKLDYREDRKREGDAGRMDLF